MALIVARNQVRTVGKFSLRRSCDRGGCGGGTRLSGIGDPEFPWEMMACRISLSGGQRLEWTAEIASIDSVKKMLDNQLQKNQRSDEDLFAPGSSEPLVRFPEMKYGQARSNQTRLLARTRCLP